MEVIIDRFEGKKAVCEKTDRTMINISRNKLPAEAKEGDVLVIEGDDVHIDSAATLKRRQAAEEMLRRNFNG
jgi:hypothetical protein